MTRILAIKVKGNIQKQELLNKDYNLGQTIVDENYTVIKNMIEDYYSKESKKLHP